MTKSFYITTPIYYVNDKPHIGHAYTSVAADVLARFQRLHSSDVMFLTGTDEHGQKIEKSASKAGISPEVFVDNLSLQFRDLKELLHLSHDDFIRTTENRHKEYVKQIWNKVLKSGYIYLSKYSGWYAVRDEAFYAESELVDGKAPTGADVEWVEEDSYFFKLSEFGDKLLQWYQDHPDFILPESKRTEVISFVESGLRDLSLSRTTFRWGIEVPNDDKHIIYVWFDALFNYISALEDKAGRFWPCDLHIIGKDILRFHAVYWPAFLMAAELELPKRIFAHGWWTNEGQKISKSLGNVIDPKDLIAKFGVDYVRYFLMRAIPFGNDGDFSEAHLIVLINSELANNIGNLIQRTLSMIHKNCASSVPPHGILQAADNELLEKLYSSVDVVVQLMDRQKIHLAMGVIVEIGSAANIYIDKHAPWKLAKNDVERMNDVLYVLVEAIRVIAILLQSFIPEAAKKILNVLQLTEQPLSHISKLYAIVPGTVIKESSILFPRLL